MNALLQGAIQLLEAHPAVESVKVEETSGGGANVYATFLVDLPSRWAAAGASPNGVRAREEVLVEFPSDFPDIAPRFTLREDFPDALPHIYLHKRGGRVPPCITFGDKLDVMHSDGFFRLVDQMSDWLNKAAVDELAINEKGWEPSRREVGFNFVEMDPAEHFVKPPFGGWRLFICMTCWSKDGRWSIARDPQLKSPVGDPGFMHEWLKTLGMNERAFCGRVPLVFCWPQSVPGEQPAVHERYKADTVTTFAELAEQAAEWGCRVALDDFVSNFNRVLATSKYKADVLLYFAFPVRRPTNIIGTQSQFEMVAYKMQLSLPTKLSVDDTAAVGAVAFSSPISSKLLRRTSALQEQSKELKLTFAGCGSLGSKVAMHVARAGGRAALLIDEKLVVAHNVARHALLPDDVSNLQGKAERLAQIMGSFGSKRPKFVASDVRGLDFNEAKYRDFFRGEQSVVVHTTGSPAVRDFFARAKFEARVVEGALVHHGKAAFITVEGQGRNPSTIDLLHHSYEQLRLLGLLRDAGVTAAANILEIGIGCHSVTIAMSDARVSLVAAGIGQRLHQYDEVGLPETGISSVASVGDDGMSIAWSHDEVGATHVAEVFDGKTWTVRVLDRAHKKIVADVAEHPAVETGGIIVGNVSALTREIFITDVLPASPDSTRAPERFVLGVEGTMDAIRDYEALGGHTLWCLGTWHSHLAVSGPSQIDRDTAQSLDGQIRHAAVLLIRHPEGYAALVRDGSPA
ncbi:ThiF family protein [Paraburkholderia bryophila]|uniref:ThiF family protein n=3 Tax=Paraburkholderia bryophila TaxID=420952 RepID=A0A329D241_9BURK|nr:Mov34/MPN/PAD-1 family protein [Paraburkholderia bryophila]RAS38334.1 ThiF family protein [Paraburkholderia bryophila]